MIDSARTDASISVCAAAFTKKKERVNWARMEFCVAESDAVADRVKRAGRVLEAEA